MSSLLALLLLGAAVWFVLTTAGGGRGTREPSESVSEFSRAMRALDPARPMPGTRPAPRR